MKRKNDGIKIVLPKKRKQIIEFDDDLDLDIYDMISKSIGNPKGQKVQKLAHLRVKPQLKSLTDSYEVIPEQDLLSEKVAMMNKRLENWKMVPVQKDIKTKTKGSSRFAKKDSDFIKISKLLIDTHINLKHIFVEEFQENPFVEYDLFILYLYSVVYNQLDYFIYKQKERFNGILRKIQHLNEHIDTEFQEKFTKTGPEDVQEVQRGRLVEKIEVPQLVLKRLGFA